MSADPTPGSTLNASSPLAQFLAAGVLGLTGVLAALGVTGGAIARIMRNEWSFLPCFLVIVLAVGIGVIAPVVSRQVPDRVLVPGVIVLLLALGWMAGLAVKTANSQERPNVSASLVTSPDNRLVVEASITTGGLKTDQYVLVRVEGHSPAPLAEFHVGAPRKGEKGDVLQATDRGGGSYQIVYTARAGPEEDGTVDAAVKSEIPAHLYDSVIVSAIVFTPHTDKLSDQGIRRCRSLSAHWGCAILLAPEPRVELPK